MSQYIKKIKTNQGDKQIDYNALANLPTPFSTNKNIEVTTEGWYRVATSAENIYNCLGTFRLHGWSPSSHTSAIIHAGTNYGQSTSSKISVAHCGVFGLGSITKARIVYHTTYSGNYAYLELYVVASEDKSTKVNVEMSNKFGWTLIDPTIGSIPDGYSSKEVVLINTDVQAQLDNIANPNLLINGDFQVWQRGTNFSNIASQYTADRWMIKNSKGNTSIVAKSSASPASEPMQSSMRIKETIGNNTCLRYSFDNALNGTYTLSFWYYTNVAFNTYISDNGTEKQIVKASAIDTWTRATVTFTATALNYIDIVHAMPVGECYITGVKLEYGAIATRFMPRLYGEELELCGRYFQYYYRTPIYATSDSGTYYATNIQFRPVLRAIPTVTVKEILDGGVAIVSDATLSNTTSTIYNITNIQLSKNIGKYGYITCIIDAEIY